MLYILTLPRAGHHAELAGGAGLLPPSTSVIWTIGNLILSGQYEPTFFSWVWVHALMAVRTLTLSLVKYLCDAVDFCETAQLPLRSLSVEKV